MSYTQDSGLSFWMLIEASDPGVGISLEDRAPVQVLSYVLAAGMCHICHCR